MGIAEILAKKQAKLAAEQKAIEDQGTFTEPEKLAEDKSEPLISAQLAAKIEKVSATAKPMTFAEKMAAKKVSQVVGSELHSIAQSVPKSFAVVEEKPKDKPIPPLPVKEIAEKISAYVATNPEVAEVSSEVQQAYSDISQRIESLTELMEEDLTNAMSELKKSLMQNPAAVSLMLDQDIGQMVIALRRMTHVEIAAATSEKKTKGPKASKVSLTADQLIAAFEEL